MDELITQRLILLDELAEIDDTIAIYRQLARENGDNDDYVGPSPSSVGHGNINGNDDDDDNNNDIQISFDFSGDRMDIFPEGPGSPSTTSDDEDVEIITSSPKEPSKLSLRETPSIVYRQGSRQDPRLKSDQWLCEKPNESFSRDFLQEIGTQRLCNTLHPKIFVIMLVHPNAANCPANKACDHWELRWDDRPRREPGTLELELICLDRRDRGDFIDLPGKKLVLLDKDHPVPIKCAPCFLFNSLKPDFSSLDGTHLDVVLFRMLQPDDGEDENPVEERDESEGINLDHPCEKIGWTEAYRYMDRCGRRLVTLTNE